jgi:hypothetical protein
MVLDLASIGWGYFLLDALGNSLRMALIVLVCVAVIAAGMRVFEFAGNVRRRWREKNGQLPVYEPGSLLVVSEERL